jgi:type I restriction enzyme S subunit
MRPETFFEKFDQLADASNATAKIRSLLIHFAVNGKLVPNDPREKPVGLALSGPSEGYATLPASWRSGLLGEAFTFQYGDNLPAPKRSETGEYPVYGSNGIVGTHDTYITKEPAIIVGRKGSAGALNIATGPSWTTDVAYFVVPPRDLDLRFTYYLFSTLQLDALGKGIKPGLSRKEAYVLPIAIPPLAEQKRIVAKVDELMALCDRLEAQQQERETRHATLASASLARFTDAPTPANLNVLFHDSYTVEPADLRKSILTLAVQGKLVSQDPNDEPAEHWMRTIAKPNPNSEGDIGEPTFPLPSGWIWLRVASVFEVAGGIQKTPNRAPRNNAFPYLGVANVYRGRLNLMNVKKFELEPGELERRRLEAGDLLIIEGNGSFSEIGRCAKWNGEIKNCVHQNHVIRCRPCDSRIADFVLLFLNSPNGMDIMQRLAITSSGLYSLSVGKIRQIEIPLPPFAEQRRIVAKVDQLMALVAQLEAQLSASKVTAGKLIEAVVGEFTAQT